MIYNAIVEKVCLCGCGDEGDLYIDIDGVKLRVYYQAPDEFILDYLVEGRAHVKTNALTYELIEKSKPIQLDLWLVYGHFTVNESKIKRFPTDLSVCGGNVSGEVVKMLEDDNYRLDCGIFIDVKEEKSIEGLIVGDFIEVRGTYQVCFPETEWDWV